MLTTLTIRNVVLIDQLTIEFENGLCALTGETGAGKSILLDSLGLALGSRAESRLVRKGADKSQVSAVFEINSSHPVYDLLKEADIESADDGALIVRRTLTADGRSKAFINDQPVSAGLLRDIGDMLVEIHGQFDTQGLLNPSTHRAMLDEYAGLDGALESVWSDWQAAKHRLDELHGRSAAAKEEEEYLRQSLEDIDALDPKEGEEEHLASLRDRLMNREQVLEALNAAYAALGSEDDPVSAAWGVIERAASKIGGEADAIIGALERASSEMQEALTQIQSLSADLQESDYNLEEIDERLHALRMQARKHHCSVDELPAKREELAAQLNDIEHADELLIEVESKVKAARVAYIRAAEEVSQKRKEIGVKLDSLIAQELPPLKLDKARFVTSLETLEEGEWGAHGMERVRFLVSTNPGAEPGPLNKIASGGEMSRFMLALKVVMAQVGTASSLIFDEVDAGIGGSTADAVGERLARLAAEGKQVMVVTHAPQVAARASHHYIVMKGGDQDVTTTVVQLEGSEKRREEIARMLAGATITNEARAAADKLLETGRAA